MRTRVLNRLLELVDDGLGGRQIGVPHAQIDDVHAVGARAGLDGIDVLEDVGRQAADAVKVFVHFVPRRTLSGSSRDVMHGHQSASLSRKYGLKSIKARTELGVGRVRLFPALRDPVGRANEQRRRAALDGPVP